MRSKEELESRLGVPVTALSAPHGRWDNRVASRCAEAGYRRLYTSSPWAARRRDDIEIVGRLMVSRSMDSVRLIHWLTMSRTEAAFQHLVQSLKRSLRYTLGNSLYHRLWIRLAGWNGPDDT